jgi:hypothetical protein
MQLWFLYLLAPRADLSSGVIPVSVAIDSSLGFVNEYIKGDKNATRLSRLRLSVIWILKATQSKCTSGEGWGQNGTYYIAQDISADMRNTLTVSELTSVMFGLYN